VGDFRSPRAAYLSTTPPSSPTLQLQPRNLNSKVPYNQINPFKSTTTPNKQQTTKPNQNARSRLPQMWCFQRRRQDLWILRRCMLPLFLRPHLSFILPLISISQPRRSNTNYKNRAAPTKPLIFASASSTTLNQPSRGYGIRMGGKSCFLRVLLVDGWAA
jgi:hypothetical protein